MDSTVHYLFSSVQIMSFFMSDPGLEVMQNFLSTHVRIEFEIFLTIKMQTKWAKQKTMSLVPGYIKNTNILQNYDQNKLRLVWIKHDIFYNVWPGFWCDAY